MQKWTALTLATLAGTTLLAGPPEARGDVIASYTAGTSTIVTGGYVGQSFTTAAGPSTTGTTFSLFSNSRGRRPTPSGRGSCSRSSKRARPAA